MGGAPPPELAVGWREAAHPEESGTFLDAVPADSRPSVLAPPPGLRRSWAALGQEQLQGPTVVLHRIVFVHSAQFLYRSIISN
jgi:hypothetical protein